MADTGLRDTQHPLEVAYGLGTVPGDARVTQSYLEVADKIVDGKPRVAQHYLEAAYSALFIGDVLRATQLNLEVAYNWFNTPGEVFDTENECPIGSSFQPGVVRGQGAQLSPTGQGFTAGVVRGQGVCG